jgi:5-(carboxyamino)imidazole ribonucleotide synthase
MGPLGILGGGQLGRMLLQAVSSLGVDVVIGERSTASPAARLTSHEVLFKDWSDEAAVRRMAELAPVVTLESEFVDARVLERLETLGAKVWPSPRCMATVQDKLLQKLALARAELPVPEFVAIDGPGDVREFAKRVGWPVMLKARRDGYDGHGNALATGPSDMEAALGKLQGKVYAEAFVPFERELAVLVVRGQDGQMESYPVVETQQDSQLHICRVVIAPADISNNVVTRATAIARGAAEAVDVIGALGVEMFLLSDGQVLINELAPRPHNSAHYSIEACTTSQFMNHARAVLGLPLGSAALRAPAAVMVNLLGAGGSATPDLSHALRVENTYLHWYGKGENRAGRKLGHVTSLGATRAEALERAQTAANAIVL